MRASNFFFNPPAEMMKTDLQGCVIVAASRHSETQERYHLWQGLDAIRGLYRKMGLEV